MTVAKTTLSFSALAIAGSMLAITSFSTSAFASVSSDLMNCKYNTKQKTISCCQQVIRGKKLPAWFIESGNKCNSVVKCTGRYNGEGSRQRCYVYIPEFETRDGGRSNDDNNNDNDGHGGGFDNLR